MAYFVRARYWLSLCVLAILGNAVPAFAVGHWSEGRAYSKGDEALYDGRLWQAVRWSQGERPDQATEAVWREQQAQSVTHWRHSQIYTAGDTMLFDGKVWQAKWWNEGQAPTGRKNDVWAYVTDLHVDIVATTKHQLQLEVTDSVEGASFAQPVTIAIPVPSHWKYVVSLQQGAPQKRAKFEAVGSQISTVHTHKKNEGKNVVKIEGGMANVTLYPEKGPLVLESVSSYRTRPDDNGLKYRGIAG